MTAEEAAFVRLEEKNASVERAWSKWMADHDDGSREAWMSAEDAFWEAVKAWRTASEEVEAIYGAYRERVGSVRRMVQRESYRGSQATKIMPFDKGMQS